MTTPKELRRLANELVARSMSIDERSYAVILALREAADEIDRLTAEVERLKQQSVDLLGEQLEAK
jgi:hypothetical protein